MMKVANFIKNFSPSQAPEDLRFQRMVRGPFGYSCSPEVSPIRSDVKYSLRFSLPENLKDLRTKICSKQKTDKKALKEEANQLVKEIFEDLKKRFLSVGEKSFLGRFTMSSLKWKAFCYLSFASLAVANLLGTFSSFFLCWVFSSKTDGGTKVPLFFLAMFSLIFGLLVVSYLPTLIAVGIALAQITVFSLTTTAFISRKNFGEVLDKEYKTSSGAITQKLFATFCSVYLEEKNPDDIIQEDSFIDNACSCIDAYLVKNTGETDKTYLKESALYSLFFEEEKIRDFMKMWLANKTISQ